MALQYQLDLAKASEISSTVVLNLLQACAEDDIQPIVVPSLEVFGSWLMADSDRINMGGDALRNSRNKTVAFLKVVIGMPKALSKIVRDNLHLTSSFLFAVGCSNCFDTVKTGQLMHEIMRLNGILRSYPLSSHLVCEFVDKIKGHEYFLQGDSPSQIFNQIIRAVSEQLTQQNLRLDDLFDDSEVRKLAEIIYNVFEDLKNEDIRHLTLEGSRSGAWLASLFLWLPPKEVDVSVNNFRVYPSVQDKAEGNTIRLSINFVPPRELSSSSWSIKRWESQTKIENLVVRMNEEFLTAKKHPSPLGTARYQVAISESSEEVVDAVGYLASALVVVATTRGHLINEYGSSEKHLIDLCSDDFLNAYPTMMERFGWRSLNKARRDHTVWAIEGCIDGGNAQPTDDKVDLLGTMISLSSRKYFDRFGEPMLTRNDFREREIVEYAIHVATEALLFSLCFECPKNPKYRPFETNALNRNAELLFSILLVRPDQQSICKGCNFWDLRAHIMDAIVPRASATSSVDLAVAGDGYIAYSAALLAIDTDMTDRRRIASLCVSPGSLRREGMQGQFEKLVEHQNPTRIAARTLDTDPRPVELFGPGGKFQGVNDYSARTKLEITVEHLVALSNDRRSTLYFTTYLNESFSSSLVISPAYGGAIPSIPAQWKRSIDAVAFASHINQYTSLPDQHKALAERWKSKDFLGENTRWCLVGKDLLPNRRYITTTSGSEQLRFFEAGSVAPGRKIFIRQRQVPLIHCVKEAMEACGEDPKWVIIS